MWFIDFIFPPPLPDDSEQSNVTKGYVRRARGQMFIVGMVAGVFLSQVLTILAYIAGVIIGAQLFR